MANTTEDTEDSREVKTEPGDDIMRPDSRDKLKKNVTIPRGIALMVGAISGSTIFVLPSSVAKAVRSPASSILIWLMGGVVALCGGLVFCELGTMYPVSGGEVVYLKKIYGPLVGFLSVFTLHFLLGGLKEAINILAFSAYFWALFYKDPLFEASWWLLKAVPLSLFAVAVVLAITKPDMILKSISFITALQVSSMILIIIAGIVSLANGRLENISEGFDGTNLDTTGLGIASNGVIYAYFHWEIICSLTSEVQNPKRNLPIIVVSSVAIVTSLYVLTVISLHIVMPSSVMAEEEAVAVQFGVRTIGEPGRIVVGVAIALSSLGSIQSVLIAISRYIHSGSVEGLLPSCLGLVSNRFKTPLVSILSLAGVTTVFVLVGGIEDLVAWATFMIFPFHVACAVGVFILRRTCPDSPRPFKVPLIFPGLFVVFGMLFFVTPFLGKDWPESLICLSMLFLAVLIYFVIVKNLFQFRFLRRMDQKLTAKLAQVLNCD